MPGGKDLRNKIVVVAGEAYTFGGNMLLGEKYNIRFNLENKHTIATFKYYQEIVRWVKYKNDNYSYK